jgi:hypothetical protein
VIKPNLPQPPSSFGVPVAFPLPVAGRDVRVHRAKLAVALDEANARLRNDAEFYQDVVARYGNGGSDGR